MTDADGFQYKYVRKESSHHTEESISSTENHKKRGRKGSKTSDSEPKYIYQKKANAN